MNFLMGLGVMHTVIECSRCRFRNSATELAHLGHIGWGAGARFTAVGRDINGALVFVWRRLILWLRGMMMMDFKNILNDE